jgi:cytochrome P450
MEAPIQCFSRLLTRNYDMDEITLPAGSRAIVFYGAANRDERKFPDPHRFDVTRGSAEHIAQTERAVVGRRSMQVTRMRITDAGRRALGELRWP